MRGLLRLADVVGDGGVAGSRYIICSLSKPLALILIVKARWCMHESIFQHLFAGELIARNDLIVQFVKTQGDDRGLRGSRDGFGSH